MRIVLTNDDGFGSLGIETVKKILQKYGEVFEVAPASPQSGMSCGFTTYRKPVTVHKIDEHNFKVEGTPVDCVLFANAYLQGDFDMIVSGCNHGFNLSNDIMYSGTCGAAKQGLVFKKKCIALSADQFDDDKHIKKYVPQVFKYLFDNDLLSGDYYLNVNLHPEDKPFKGFRITKLHLRYLSKYTLTELGGNEYKVTHIHDDDIFDNDDYDVSAVNSGYVSITPISLTNYKEEFYNIVKNKI